jgi:hypothetical protein
MTDAWKRDELRMRHVARRSTAAPGIDEAIAAAVDD